MPGLRGAGRYAPSPTGELHLGNLRTAVLAWLFARSDGRRFLLRIEDLDAGRVRPGVAEQQAADLAALGLDFDPPTLVQSARTDGLRRRAGRAGADARSSASAPAGRSPRRPARRTARCPATPAPAAT